MLMIMPTLWFSRILPYLQLMALRLLMVYYSQQIATVCNIGCQFEKGSLEWHRVMMDRLAKEGDGHINK
jgi:hypothetical protein